MPEWAKLLLTQPTPHNEGGSSEILFIKPERSSYVGCLPYARGSILKIFDNPPLSGNSKFQRLILFVFSSPPQGNWETP